MEKDLFNDVVGQSEEALQQKAYLWFWNKYPEYRGLLFHVPNGGTRNAREGRRLKLIGVYPGVSDLIFLYAGRAFLFELKDEKGRQSKEQVKWQVITEENGFKYYIIRSLSSFKLEITTIIDTYNERLGNN